MRTSFLAKQNSSLILEVVECFDDWTTPEVTQFK